jgi:parvulin-like peptidyl-prolyl isomerase
VKPFRFLFALVVSGGLALGLVACSSASPYAVKVNSSMISRSQLDVELNNVAHSARYVSALQGNGGQVTGTAPGTFTQAFTASTLNQLVEYDLIHADLVRRNALPKAADVETARKTASQQFADQQGSFFNQFAPGYQTTLARRQAEVQALQTALGTDAADQQYYDTHKGQFATEVCVRHILLAKKDAKGNIDFPATLSQADQVKAQLAGGDANFAALAKQYSQDNQGTGNSASKGGDLAGSAADGCMTPTDLNQLVAPFVRAVATMPVGQVSPPVQTQFGYHLIEVTSRQIPPYSASLKSTVSRGLFLNFLQTALQKANLKVSPQFGTINKGDSTNGDVPTIVPPAAPSVSAGTSTTTGG